MALPKDTLSEKLNGLETKIKTNKKSHVKNFFKKFKVTKCSTTTSFGPLLTNLFVNTNHKLKHRSFVETNIT